VIEIPEVVRHQAVNVGADDWLANLNDIVAELATSWSIIVGATFPDATEAYVAEAVRDDGELLVLKIHIPREGGFAQSEITTLRLANGDSCVLLVDYDVTLGALLLERLGPSLRDLALPIDRRHEILCCVAERMWRPAPDCGLPNGRLHEAELRIQLQPGDLMIFNNMAVAHGRRGTRQQGELRQRVYGRRLHAEAQSQLRDGVLAAFRGRQ